MSGTEAAHVPVLLDAVIEGLAVTPAGSYVDATFGRGGHSEAILRRLNADGRLLVMDRDPDAIAWARRQYGADPRVQVVQGTFSMLEQAVKKAGMMERINGVLIDPGVSSPQLDDPARGFSFMSDGALDMRMDPTAGEPVSAWLNRATQSDIARVLRDYGEQPGARRIARAIINARPLHRTRELADVIAAAVPRHEPGRHPATRTFQALRIFINRELDELRAVLPQALRVLAPGGRLAVISFHSLEDRIVKRFMRDESRGDPYPADLPVPAAALRPRLRRIGAARRPETGEIERNPRARSAVLRIAERLAA